MKPVKFNLALLAVSLVLNSPYIYSQFGGSLKIDIGEGVVSEVVNGYKKEVVFPEPLNLSEFKGVSAVICNTGNEPFRIEAMLNNSQWVSTGIYLEPGELKELQINMNRPRGGGEIIFSGMKGFPGGSSFATINAAKINGITFIIYTKGKASLRISGVKPFGEYVSSAVIAQGKGFYPFIDRYGQYRHITWPGKTINDEDLKQSAAKEQKELQSIPGPEGRSRYGGWADGPKLKATGHFRTEKVNGKWWLVDPDGYLFWSHGITCIRLAEGSTRVSGRRSYFEKLPANGDPFAAFYSSNRRDTSFNFFQANLYRKYGEEWRTKAASVAITRMKSWGINTFGNWSDPAIYNSPDNDIPYTVAVSPNWPKLDGRGYKFPDVFDPIFPETIKNAIGQADRSSFTDPRCIGFFIDNELTATNLTRALLRQPLKSRSRGFFFDFLKEKYGTIEKLNNAWGTGFRSWQKADTITSAPAGASADCHEFDLKIAEIYYRVCRDEIKKAAPEKLYFGSRLHCHFYPDDQTESDLIRIVARFCDVVCFNRYRFTPEDLILPDGVDKPTIIGEFHFGAMDRGLVYPGMRAVANQVQRAEAYYQYVAGALNNHQLVGTHWFQYIDMPFTGRSDGANAQIGFIDICDNPYPEIINASRKAGYRMYSDRYGDKK